MNQTAHCADLRRHVPVKMTREIRQRRRWSPVQCNLVNAATAQATYSSAEADLVPETVFDRGILATIRLQRIPKAKMITFERIVLPVF